MSAAGSEGSAERLVRIAEDAITAYSGDSRTGNARDPGEDIDHLATAIASLNQARKLADAEPTSPGSAASMSRSAYRPRASVVLSETSSVEGDINDPDVLNKTVGSLTQLLQGAVRRASRAASKAGGLTLPRFESGEEETTFYAEMTKQLVVDYQQQVFSTTRPGAPPYAELEAGFWALAAQQARRLEDPAIETARNAIVAARMAAAAKTAARSIAAIKQADARVSDARAAGGSVSTSGGPSRWTLYNKARAAMDAVRGGGGDHVKAKSHTSTDSVVKPGGSMAADNPNFGHPRSSTDGDDKPSHT